jgi:DNA topoisomerase I
MIGGKSNEPIKRYIIRKKIGKKGAVYKYYNMAGKPIAFNSKLKSHISTIGVAIPPSYPKVLISLDNKSKVLALGTDDKNRKQYFYNSKFTSKKTQEKYCHLIHLGQVFPDIQHDISRSLKSQNLNSNRDVFNLMLWLIINCNFRIGSESMKEQYGTTGVCTIHQKHIQMIGSKMKIEFIGKKNVINKCIVDNKQVIRFIKKILKDCNKNCRLFQITLQNGTKKFAEHTDLNQFLHDKAGVTAKEFRTWMANTLFLKYLDEYKLSDNMVERKKQIKSTIEKVAFDLHHTPGICKKSYLLDDMLEMLTSKPKDWSKYLKTVDSVYKKGKKRHTKHEWRFLSFLFKSCRSAKINL